MSTWKWYADAGLTVELARGDFVRGSTPVPVDRVLYFGSVAVGQQLRNSADPGVDQLQVSVADAAGGSGLGAADVVLALSDGSLSTNTPGAPLNIGTTLLSGAGGAVAVYMRVSSALTAIDDYDDITLEVSSYIETAV